MVISRSFDFVSGSSSKFWEISRDGVEVVVRYGRKGTTGQTTSRAFTTEEAAVAHVDTLVAAKLGKGYVECGTADAPRSVAFAATGAVVDPNEAPASDAAAAAADEDTFVVPSSWPIPGPGAPPHPRRPGPVRRASARRRCASSSRTTSASCTPTPPPAPGTT